jgi:signal transduction histidine kinase/DNA-binding NarL/FixJ family response regulator
MNLFWQITLIEFLLNVAVFSGAIILYGPMRIFAAYISDDSEIIQRGASGVLFGIATAGALLLPVHMEGGAAVGCSTILLAIAGPLDGWLAVACGVAISVSIELLPWVATEQSKQLAVVSLLVSAILGLGFRYALIYLPGERDGELQYIHLPVLGVVSAAGGVMVLGLSQGMSAASSSILPAMIFNILAAVILGTLLLHETRRSQAERELRESEVSLLGQAKELAVARDHAETANRTKSVFLANMSHELRTPLNAILGYAQLLQRDQTLTAWQTNASSTIEQSGEHLLTLITDILDLSKIEAGKIELQLTTVNLPDFIRGISDIIRIKSEEKALEFLCTIDPDVPVFVQADQKRLRQVLLNLLSNAVKFTDRGSVAMQVKLLSEPGGKTRLRFEVRDTGTGMSADQLKLVFHPFVQVGDEQHRSGGTGLGLTISRQLVRLMGGDIQVESAEGKGSCFSFDMPELIADAAKVATQTLGQVIGYEGVRKHILVVDDTDASRQVLADNLRTLGFDVSQTSNGLNALESARATPTDLILMDIRMPVMDGLEAMRQMQRNENLRKIPVIAVSAGVTEEERVGCMAAGARALLMKPIENAVLLDEVSKVLRLKWVRDAMQTQTSSGGIPVEHFVVPDPLELKSLREVVMRGNMRAIRNKADQFIALDAKYRPFADKITQLTLGYQSKALLRLVEKQIAQKQVQPVTKS